MNKKSPPKEETIKLTPEQMEMVRVTGPQLLTHLEC
jgi:hypothetical protein